MPVDAPPLPTPPAPDAPPTAAPPAADAAASLPDAVDGSPARVLRVADGELAVSARDGVTLASEADSLVLTAATEIVLSVGQSTLTLRADGTILLNGRRMTLHAPAMIELNPEPPAAEPAPTARDSADVADVAPCGCRGARRAPVDPSRP